jgi:hypothetical protein
MPVSIPVGSSGPVVTSAIDAPPSGRVISIQRKPGCSSASIHTLKPSRAKRAVERSWSATCCAERETPRVSDTVLAILLVVCLVIAVGGFVGGIKLVRRVRAEAEATNAEHTDEPG